MSRIIELGPVTPVEVEPVSGIPGMLLDSIGDVHHAISVPFHDSQARRKAILIQTGWDRRQGTDAYWEPGPYLSEELIFRLIRAQVRAVAVDFPSDTHARLAAHDIVLVDRLCNFAALPRVGFVFSIVTSPATRAFAEVAG